MEAFCALPLPIGQLEHAVAPAWLYVPDEHAEVGGANKRHTGIGRTHE